MSLLSFLRSWFRRSPLRRLRERAARRSLRVESLEDRCVPSGVPSGIGVLAPGAGWYLRQTPSPGAPTTAPFAYGGPDWVPLAGDWTGSGHAGPGVFDPHNATWYLKNWNAAGAPDVNPFPYGGPGWLPVVGDWDGNGTTTVGVVDPTTMTWYLKNSNSPGAPDVAPFRYGAPGWIPVVGDWDGNGTTTVGAFDPATATFYLRNENSAGAPDAGVIHYGGPGWIPVVGDWDGNGTSTIGVVNPATEVWYLKNSNTPGAPDIAPFAYGAPGSVPFAAPQNHTVGLPSPTTPAGPQLVLQVPATVTGTGFTATVSVAGANLSMPALFQIDVDLNHDGQFDPRGETAYASGVLGANGSGSTTLEGLTDGTYQVRASALVPGYGELTSAVTTVQLLPAPAGLPDGFEANVGQTDPQVKYLARAGGGVAFLTESGLTLSAQAPNPMAPGGPPFEVAERVQFAGGNPSPTIVGEGKLAGVSNYLIGNDPSQWHTNVPNYTQVRYQNVWPGIDAVFHGSQDNLEYDFQVAAGANPSQILVSFPDVSGGSSSLGPDGQVLLPVGPLGDLAVGLPVVYQQTAAGKVAVRAQYTARGPNQFGFQLLSPYDPSLPLVIDPTLSWSTLLGGTKDETALGLAVDSSGDTYTTGGTMSADFPTSAGVTQTKNNGGQDAFVTKLNATGTALVYSTYIGGAKDESAAAIAVDAAGDAFVTGSTQSTDYPTTAGVTQTKLGAGATHNAFVTKLKPDGTGLLYSTYLGGTGDDNARGIAVDSSGDAFVTGGATSTDFPTTTGVVATTNAGGEDVFVTELDPNGVTTVYSTYVGGAKDDLGEAIAIDSSGNAYVAGRTASTDFNTTAGVVQTKSAGGTNDAFVFKLNATGTTLTYSTYLGGSGDDHAEGLAIDSAGNAYVTGATDSTDFPTTAGAFQTKLAGGSDAFVTKLNSNGTALVYSTYLGGATGGAPNSDAGDAIAVDTNGLAYIAGATTSTDFPTTTGAFQTTNAGGSDVILTVLNATGSALPYSTYLGGSKDDVGNAIALDSTGNIYIAGTTGSTNFPTTAGVLQTSNKGGNDAFVAKFANTIIPPPPPPPPPPPGGGGVPFVPSDIFENNDTSDVATDMGAAGAVVSFPNLTINLKPTGLFDQDWYKWSIPTSGSLNVTLSDIQAFGGDLWLRVFQLNSDSTLTQIGASTVTGGVSVQTAIEGVTAGQEIYVWVFGFNNAVGSYTLNVTLT